MGEEEEEEEEAGGSSAWVQVTELGDTYYINTDTGETTTEVPDDYEEDEGDDAGAGSPTSTWITREEYGETFMSNPSTGDEFQVMQDETNQVYYLNLKTGNSQWNDPSEVQETVEVKLEDAAGHLFQEDEEYAEEEPEQPEPANEDPFDELNNMFKELQMGLEKNLNDGIGDQLDAAENVDAAFTEMVYTKAENSELGYEHVEAMTEDLRQAGMEGAEITNEEEIVMDLVEHHDPTIVRKDSIGRKQQELVEHLKDRLGATGF